MFFPYSVFDAVLVPISQGTEVTIVTLKLKYGSVLNGYVTLHVEGVVLSIKLGCFVLTGLICLKSHPHLFTEDCEWLEKAEEEKIWMKRRS